MTDDKKLKKAQSVYSGLCEMLDTKGLRYEKHDSDMTITFTAVGNDIPMRFIVNVDAERGLIRLISPIPATFEGDKRIEGAIATSQINYGLADGSFDFEYETGKVYFRLTTSFMDSIISKEVGRYMIGCAGVVVDEYNDKLLMLSKGNLSLDEFFKK